VTDADVLARILALEEKVAALRRRPQPMSRTLQCVCGGRSILHIKRIPVVHSTGSVSPLTLTYDHTDRGYRLCGPLTAYVCRECGLVELHAASLAGIAVDNDEIVEYDAREPEPEPPPFR
jgi:hypothetical protein